MTTPVSCSDPLLALAALMLDGDERMAQLDAENLVAARSEQRRALEHEVSLLHQAADHVRTGAFVEGALAIGGAALSTGSQLGGSSEKPASTSQIWLAGGGRVASALAQPAGRLFGEAPKADAEADAKRAEAAAADARSRAEQALHERDRVEQAADKMLDAIGSTLESEAQGRLAVIANV